MSMDEVMQIVEEELESKKARIVAKVEEEIESARRSIRSKLKSYFKDGNQTSSQTKMKLEFRNGIARTILTGEEIKGEEGVPIEVSLVDDVAGGVVEAEPEASAKVEFFLLKGKSDASEGVDWTAEEFDASIVPQVEGKQPILAGNVVLQLRRGVGVVENIKIRHHASKIKPPEFKLGARIVGGCRVKEAKTKAFTLKDFRTRYYRKHENPSLSDEVSRLVRIRRGGKIDKRLQENKIHTVEDFLIQLLINPQGLQSIVKSPAKKWKDIIKNAQACLSSEKMYCYIDLKQKTGVIFNILGRLLGLCSGRHYSQISTLSLSEKQKADADELLESAYQNWKEVKAFDDQNSLQQHLDGLSPHIDYTAASEMVRESSSLHSNASFHSANSRMNLFGDQTELRCFSDDIEGLYDAVMQCSQAWPNLFEGMTSEANAGDEARIVVSSGDSPRRWRKLLCVSKWYSVRRRVALDVSSDRKKQRVG